MIDCRIVNDDCLIVNNNNITNDKREDEASERGELIEPV